MAAATETEPATGDKPLNRADAVQAAYDGGEAFRAGEPVTACPWDPDAHLYGDFMHHYWLKGYRIASEEAPVTE